MYVPFDQMTPTARVWIYQSDRPLSHDECLSILEKSQVFLDQWAAHGSGLKCSAEIFHHQFLVVCVDENFTEASGCSIDASVRFVQSLGSQMGIDFFNRTNIAFLEEGKVILKPMTQLKGNLKATDIAFNNLVKDKAEMAQNWRLPVEESWLKRYL